MDDQLPVASSYVPWGPFISDDYVLLSVTRTDIIIAGAVFALANIFALFGAYVATRQTMASQRPLKNAYIWMIWLELAASVVIGIECLLFLLRIIRPSFYFYMSIRNNPLMQHTLA